MAPYFEDGRRVKAGTIRNCVSQLHSAGDPQIDIHYSEDGESARIVVPYLTLQRKDPVTREVIDSPFITEIGQESFAILDKRGLGTGGIIYEAQYVSPADLDHAQRPRTRQPRQLPAPK